MAQGRFQQSANFYEICQIIRDAGISFTHTRSAPTTSIATDVFNLAQSGYDFLKLDGSTKQSERLFDMPHTHNAHLHLS